MKRQSLLILSLVVSYGLTSSVFAQSDSTPKREFGIQISGINFNGFTSFNGIYKKQLSENKYRRLSASFGNIQFDGTEGNVNFSLNAGMSVGIEKRSSVGKKTTLYRAPEFSFGLSFSKSSRFDPNWSFTPGVSWIFGLQYDFNENWAINVEGGPGAYMSIRDFSGAQTSYSIGGSFSSNVALAIMHKF
jgi:opacity protein-like surface antigen